MRKALLDATWPPKLRRIARRRTRAEFVDKIACAALSAGSILGGINVAPAEGSLSVLKSRIGWFADRWGKAKDRRARPAAKSIALRTEDMDPALGTLPLTRFLAILDGEISSGGAGALLVLDLDGKARAAADLVARNRHEILPLLAQAIRQAVRSGDLIAHLDACRFVVLLRGAPQAVADTVARRILGSVDDTVFLVAEGLIRLSVGVGGVAFSSGTMDRRQMLERAAQNLERVAELDVRAMVQ